jgi:prepilin-type N-terminal cleavage/methylation domain-containing protein
MWNIKGKRDWELSIAPLIEFMKRGFTLVELIVVMSILATLLTFVTLDVLGSQRKVSVTSSANLLISDLAAQQLRAMAGGNGGGIFFGDHSYTLFSGINYSSSDANNFIVNLDPNIQLINSFSGSRINFASGSGEISGFVAGSDTVVLQNMFSRDKKTVKLNRLGVVVKVN